MLVLMQFTVSSLVHVILPLFIFLSENYLPMKRIQTMQKEHLAAIVLILNIFSGDIKMITCSWWINNPHDTFNTLVEKYMK